jgi:putative flavoprotein involved in K+ transport
MATSLRSMEPQGAVVAGAGAAGLAAAAMLKRAGVAPVVLERSDAVGRSWRGRYDALRLNTLRWSSSLPGYRMERRYGRWPSRDDWVSYLERYADRHQLEIRFGVEVKRVDQANGDWRLETSAGVMEARNAVIALGLDHDPYIPDWPGREGFPGKLIHASEYRNPTPFQGQDVLIVGPGNTGSEIAHDLVQGGAKLPLHASMRTPPNIVNREQFGLPILSVIALATDWQPTRMFDATTRPIQRLLFGDLSEYGLPRSPYGMKQNVLERGVAPVVDDGFITDLKRRDIEIVPEIERFEGAEVVLEDGRRLSPEVVIACTGYRRGLEPIVGHLGAVDPHLGMPRVLKGSEDPRNPGLYFIGYAPRIAGTLRMFKHEARRIARSAARRQRAGVAA